MSKKIAVSLAGSGKIIDAVIEPGNTSEDVLRDLNLEGYELSRSNSLRFGNDENIYSEVGDGEKIFASPVSTVAERALSALFRFFTLIGRKIRGFFTGRPEECKKVRSTEQVREIPAVISGTVRTGSDESKVIRMVKTGGLVPESNMNAAVQRAGNTLPVVVRHLPVKARPVRKESPAIQSTRTLVPFRPEVVAGKCQHVPVAVETDPVIIKRPELPYWKERGWKRDEGGYFGYFRTKYGSFSGFASRRARTWNLYIANPPEALKLNPHWQCFSMQGKTSRGKKVYLIHFSPVPKNLGAGIMKIEQMLIESFRLARA